MLDVAEDVFHLGGCGFNALARQSLVVSRFWFMEYVTWQN
jgi:hypothetical protein